MMQQRPYFAYVLASILTLLFIIFYGGSSWLNSLFIRHTFSPALTFEHHFPLYPQWSLVYLSLPFVMLWATHQLDWQAQWRWFVLLCGELLLACVFFLALPIHLSFDAPPNNNPFWGFWLHLAHSAGMQHNYLPSLHCAFVLSTVLVLRHKVNKITQSGLWLYALLVSFSTFAIHAHHLADIIAGWLLVFILWQPMHSIAHRTMNLATQQYWWLNNQIQFMRRHRRYAWISVILYTQYIFSPKRAQLLISGYCFLQAYDDIMDGDRILSSYPTTQCADILIDAWQRQDFSANDNEPLVAELLVLAQYFHANLRQLSAFNEAWEDVLILLEKMKYDSIRANEYRLLSQTELNEQMYGTFNASLNMLFYAFQSHLRANDVPELVKILTWCSTMRDWDADLSVGIINIPAQQWQATGLPKPCYPLDGFAISKNPIIATWLANEKKLAEQQIAQLLFRLPEIQRQYGKAAYQIVKLFTHSVAQFAHKRYPQRFKS